jgi:hypothetical protein
MAGLDPAIHAFASTTKKDVDARDKPGHDGVMETVNPVDSYPLLIRLRGHTNFKDFDAKPSLVGPSQT